MQPVLSIITVTWNCVSTLERTLRSVRAIKTDEMEYIIVDGASTDGTLELARAHGDLIDCLLSEPDAGIYNAMNKGVALAHGVYVLFINGDDELITDGFSELMQSLRSKMADIVCGTTIVGSPETPDELLVARPWRLLFFNSIPHPSAFVSRKVLNAWPFREDLRIASDYDFFLRAYLNRCRFRMVPAVTAMHQRGGASGNTQASLQEIEVIRRELLGWRFGLINTVASLYRQSKRLLLRKLS